MNPPSPTSLDLARDLLALEAARAKDPGGTVGGGAAAGTADLAGHAARVCETLRGVLTAFAGAAGFRSLLARALTLAKAHDPSLAGVQVLDGGSLAGLDAPDARTTTGPTNAGGVLLVAHLLDLLVTFIGEPLTLQLVRGTWPEAARGAIRTRDRD